MTHRFNISLKPAGVVGAVLGCFLLLNGCAYPIRNQQAADLSDRKGYRWSNLRPAGHSDTLVIVTASGGGTRAAALELSVLQGMAQVRMPDGGVLADEIDVLSSVSGGSVTAAHFALFGREGFGALERDFIRQDGIGAILAEGLPVGLIRASTPSVERIDFLIDYLDRTLFKKGETFGNLLARGSKPYLVLNAADMVEGVPFAFTQANFDLLCSDLSTVKLSTAVAASAAFPIALSPVTLKNYSTCPAQAMLPEWPPAWAKAAANTNWYKNPERNSRGRTETAYALGNSAANPKSYVHLLDGGIADNLGVAEPYRMLTTDAPAPAFVNDIAKGHYRNIVFVMINSRSFASSKLDKSPETAGIADMLLGTVSSSIDRATVGAADKLREALGDQFDAIAADMVKLGQEDFAKNLVEAKSRTKLVEIDFDAIPDIECRRKYHQISTSWTNSKNEIDSLLLVGKALLKASPRFSEALDVLGAHLEQDFPELAAACAKLDGGDNNL
jgi:NTE family protein